MTTQIVEYIVRARFKEPPDDPTIHPENRIGDEMHSLLGEIELVAEEQEIVSRRIVADAESEVIT